jgi:trigger factor
MLIEGCKHELEITVPEDEIARETERVVSDLQKKVRLPGFRPGKAPASIIRSRFGGEVRQDVLEHLVPRHFQKKVQEEELNVVGVPNIKDVHFHEGEPMRFKAEFEVAPVIELKDHRGVTVHYHEPEVTPEDIDKRMEEIRDRKAQFVNIDPRPAADGDYAVISLDSLGGVEPPIHQDEMTLLVGDLDKLPEFTEALRGLSPGEEKAFDIQYPEDYAQQELAGKSVSFLATLKTLQRKELPDLNDEFAKDLGDYQTLDQVREAIRVALARERELAAQGQAKEELIDKLIESHDFPVPEAYVERQIEAEAEDQFRRAMGKEIDIKKLKESVEWERLREGLHAKAVHDVKASLLIDRVAEVENLYATQDEVDKEVQRFARQTREPVAAARKKLEKSGAIARIANRIRNEKAINLLFEHARKEA